MENILIIVESIFVQVVDLVNRQSYGNQVGEIDIKPLMAIRVFADNFYQYLGFNAFLEL